MSRGVMFGHNTCELANVCVALFTVRVSVRNDLHGAVYSVAASKVACSVGESGIAGMLLSSISSGKLAG